MISTKQDAALLTYFLLEIRRAGATVPSVAVTDFSRAILLALARAFADCANLKHYLQCCYDIAVRNKDTFLPASYLRLDVSHIIKMISNWECLRHQPRKVRQFYLRCVSQAYKMQSIQELYSFLTSLLVVALSEDVGYIDETYVPAQENLQFINDCIKGTCIEESDNVVNEISSTDDFDYKEVPLCWQEWADEMYTKANTLALESCNGNIVNAFYNPKAAEKIKDLIKHLPLWTGIMRPYFKIGTEIATSSSVESIFAEYKNRIFKGCIPMRVDKFVISHLTYLDGRLRLDFAATQESKISAERNIETSLSSDSFNDVPVLNSTPINENVNNDYIQNDTQNDYIQNEYIQISDDNNSTISTKKFDDNVFDESYSTISDLSVTDNSLNYKENWMGLIDKDNKKYDKIKKRTYLDKCPE